SPRSGEGVGALGEIFCLSRPAGPPRRSRPPNPPQRGGSVPNLQIWHVLDGGSHRPARSTRARRRRHGTVRARMSTATSHDLKHRSRALTEGPERAAARAYLKGIGYDEDALSRPLVAVANTWIETMPCNFHLRALAAKVKDG